MAMIQCSECGKEISDRASVCPHCGCPILTLKSAKDRLIKNAEKIISPIIERIKGLPQKTVAISAVVVVLLLAILCIPSGAKRDKATLKKYLLEPSSLTIYEAYTNNKYGDDGRATLFYFGAKNKAGGTSDDWALVYDGEVQFKSNFDKAERNKDNKGILNNADVIEAKFAVSIGGKGWKKVAIK